jgi:hypothetical protein
VTEDEARAAVERAISELAQARDYLRPGELVGDWVVVFHLAKAEPDDESSYGLETSSGHGAPTHIVLGLLEQGREIVNSSPPEPRE